VKRALLLSVAVLFLAWLLRRVGAGELWTVLSDLHPGWLAATLLLFVPTLLVTAARWRIVASVKRPISLGAALRMVLAAAAANVVLPAKLGDVGKGAFLLGGSTGDRATGLALALFEKLSDVAALATWMLLASAWAWPGRDPEQLACGLGAGFVAGFAALCVMPLAPVVRLGLPAPLFRALAGVASLRARPRRLLGVLAVSFGLWGLHLLQFQLAAWAAGATAQPAVLASRIPMAIFVGLVPVSFAGIGTRDAALLYLLSPFLDAPVALALGAFATLRYLVPAAVGLLFVGSYRTGMLS